MAISDLKGAVWNRLRCVVGNVDTATVVTELDANT